MKTKLFSLILALVFYSLPSQFLVNDSFETVALGNLPSGYTIKYNGTGTANQKVVNTVVKNGAHSLQLEGAGSWSAELYRTITFPQL